ncbi:hypothetical protein NUU61_000464 [Penicillium alfredii]|uniref:Uncharacterized protein n=1 Tax=Penicillium alfredii TaxID=1506179 RepID=A0A9W9KQP8_9EURO|nr:uncharacterized protein NUU61_000464 [Penicillium alfredii]KAJ5114705.1 hypothetical protein NUU61_000464 [Penicillium alfredii]
MGVGGTYELPRRGVTIEGVHLTGTIPWMIRWDKDPSKGVHINAVWGKGRDRVKVAYQFHRESDGQDIEGWNEFKKGVKSLNKATKIKTYKQRTDEENNTHKVVFKDGGNQEDAVKAIVEKWTSLIGTPSPC